MTRNTKKLIVPQIVQIPADPLVISFQLWRIWGQLVQAEYPGISLGQIVFKHG